MYTAQYQITTLWSLSSVCWSRDWFYKASAWRQQLVGDGGEDEAQLGSILHTGRSYCSASQEADPAHTSNLPHWPPIEQCSLKLMSHWSNLFCWLQLDWLVWNMSTRAWREFSISKILVRIIIGKFSISNFEIKWQKKLLFLSQGIRLKKKTILDLVSKVKIGFSSPSDFH